MCDMGLRHNAALMQSDKVSEKVSAAYCQHAGQHWDQQVLKVLVDPGFLPVNLPRQARLVGKSRIRVAALRLHQ